MYVAASMERTIIDVAKSPDLDVGDTRFDVSK